MQLERLSDNVWINVDELPDVAHVENRICNGAECGSLIVFKSGRELVVWDAVVGDLVARISEILKGRE